MPMLLVRKFLYRVSLEYLTVSGRWPFTERSRVWSSEPLLARGLILQSSETELCSSMS